MPSRVFKRRLGREEHMPNLFYLPGDVDGPAGSSASSVGSSSARTALPVLSVPRFAFKTPYAWKDIGSSTTIAEGANLEDGQKVFAKIAATSSAAGLTLEREVLTLTKLSQSGLEAASKGLRIIDYYVVPPDRGGVNVLILKHPGPNHFACFFPQRDSETFLFPTEPHQSEDIEHGLTREEMAMVPPSEYDETRTPSRASPVQHDLAAEIDALLVEQTSRPDGLSPGSAGEEAFKQLHEDAARGHVEVDIPSFLEFASQATHCLEVLHARSIAHREIRPNAFVWSQSAGTVQFAHFGNRSVSLEGLGGPSNLVLEAETAAEDERRRIRDSIAYLAPEQTGRVQYASDYRTDLYSLGVTFYALLVGSNPFDGNSSDIFNAIVTKTPPRVHEQRLDVPRVISDIIAKLLEKDPDKRYCSPVGLRADFSRCSALLAEGWTRTADSELIPYFEIASADKCSTFNLPTALFGRQRELDTIHAVARRVSSTHSLFYSASAGPGASTVGRSKMLYPTSAKDSSAGLTGSTTGHTTATFNICATTTTGGAGVQTIDSMSSIGSGSQTSNAAGGGSGSGSGVGGGAIGILGSGGALGKLRAEEGIIEESNLEHLNGRKGSVGGSSNASTVDSNGRRKRTHGNTKERLASARAIIIMGSSGVGKSALALESQTTFRQMGFYGVAKFDPAVKSPYSAALTCFSYVFRQLQIEYPADLPAFVDALKLRLGPQLSNVQLLFSSVPELFNIMERFGLEDWPPLEQLAPKEAQARFKSLVLDIMSTLAQIKVLSILLEDLHDADDASLDLIRSLASAKIRMLIIVTIRQESEVFVARIKELFGTGSRATYITLGALSLDAVSSYVSRTLHQPPSDIVPLVELIVQHTQGNAFTIRDMLLALKRHDHLFFDYAANQWCYNLESIQSSFFSTLANSGNACDLQFIVSHLEDLPKEVKRFLVVASFFGETIKLRDIVSVIDSESDSDDTTTSEDSEDEPFNNQVYAKASISGLSLALSEGWITSKGRDSCSFTHDRYRQAAINLAIKNLKPEQIQILLLKIVDILLSRPKHDIFTVAEHITRCIPTLLLRPNEKYRDILRQAGNLALTQGAQIVALRYFQACESLRPEDGWEKDFQRTFDLRSAIASLLTWKGDDGFVEAREILDDLLVRACRPFDKAKTLRLASQTAWAQTDLPEAADLLFRALDALNVKLSADTTEAEAAEMHVKLSARIIKLGVDAIVALPRANSEIIELASTILSECATVAYWASRHNGGGLHDLIGLKLVELSLDYGHTASTSTGWVWFSATASEELDKFPFAGEVGRLALKLTEMHGSNTDRGRVFLLYGGLIGPHDGNPLSANVSRFTLAGKYAKAAGDRSYVCFAAAHGLAAKLYAGIHFAELLIACEETLDQIAEWGQTTHIVWMARGPAGAIKAIAGKTSTASPETIFVDDEDDTETTMLTDDDLALIESVPRHFYLGYKLLALHALGWFETAAELGFTLWDDRVWHPNHYHVRLCAHYHSLSLIEVIRKGEGLSPEEEARYQKQIELNQAFISRWLETASNNYLHWIRLVEAELASLDGDSQQSFRLYDQAIKLASEQGYSYDEALAMHLSGSHFRRVGVDLLGRELQARGISRLNQLGAYGTATQLSRRSGACLELGPVSKFSAEIGIQTDQLMSVGPAASLPSPSSLETPYTGDSDQIMAETGLNFASLTVDDLAAIIRSSQIISGDVSLHATLESLTELMIDNSGADSAVIIVAHENVYNVVTSLKRPGSCSVFMETPIPVSEFSTDLFRSIANQVLGSRKIEVVSNVATDPRMVTFAEKDSPKSIVCLPISSKGICIGAIYLTSGRTNAFSISNVSVLKILANQAASSLNSAMLFKKLQRATTANLRMIDAQKKALEEARKSRADAIAASKIKSNFLASMSHELRTPFSSFYGLLSLLSETELNKEQRDFVTTARGSCELLLEIIDSLLDFSKLEAGAVKLEVMPFSPEDALADGIDLMITMAAKKNIRLSYDVAKDVPVMVSSDPSRLRQVMLNILGNSLKFADHGQVIARLSVVSKAVQSDKLILLWEVEDSGIGISKEDQAILFKPFSQVDGSTTRLFGGTGLGLSICRQIVHLLDGEIGVDSTLGKGSRFWWTIPVSRVNSPQSQKLQASAMEFQRSLLTPEPLSVLVSSPSEADANLILTILAGANVNIVTTPAATRFALMTGRFELVLLDIKAPGDLAEMLELAKQSPGKPEIVHLIVPTSEFLKVSQVTGGDIVRLHLPIRREKLQQTVLSLRNGKGVALLAVPPKLLTKTIDMFTDAEKEILSHTNILIAEDNPVASKLLCKTLERLGITVIPTFNGAEAVAVWEQYPPGYFACLLSDHHMPGSDGPQAASRIRLLESKRKIKDRLPIIGLSADAQQSAKALCISSGMNDTLVKPLRADVLASVLRRFVLPRTPTVDAAGGP